MKDFDATELKGAVTAVGTAFEEFKKTNDERLAQIEAKGSADPLIDDKLKKIEDSIDAGQKKLEAFQLSQKRQSRLVTDTNGNEIDLDKKASDWVRGLHGAAAPAEFGAAGMEAYKSAFNHMMRKGDRMMGADELKALSVGTDADGGFSVHPDLSGQVVTQVYESSPMRAYASAQTISTSSLEGIYDQDEAAAGWVTETAARPNTDTPQIGRWSFEAFEMYANPASTQKMLDDSVFNVEAWLSGKVADKFARLENAAFVNGNGTTQPKGFLTYTAGTTLPLQIEQIDTGAAGAFVAAPNGGDVLIDAIYGLKAQYRANATWFMNRATTKLTRKIKDSDGAYVWQAGIAAGQPATLLGYGTASFEDMPDPAADSLSIAVGDMRAAYQIVDRQGIRVLRDPYSNKPYVNFYSVKRVGGGVVNAEAIKLIKFAA
jgi:HK97 family phage major capsid protein